MTARVIPLLLASILLTGVSGLEKNWTLWPSPWDGAEELDLYPLLEAPIGEEFY